MYLVDGLLIDTGVPKWGDRLVKVMADHEIKLIVNTYYSLENIGNKRSPAEGVQCTDQSA